MNEGRSLQEMVSDHDRCEMRADLASALRVTQKQAMRGASLPLTLLHVVNICARIEKLTSVAEMQRNEIADVNLE